MSTAETPSPGLEVTVGDDGSIAVPAETLARYGVHPGMHLRLVPELAEVQRPKYKPIKGILTGKIDVEAFEEGMAWGKQERIAEVTRDDALEHGLALVTKDKLITDLGIVTTIW